MQLKTKVRLFIAIFSVLILAYLLAPAVTFLLEPTFSSTGWRSGLFEIFRDPAINFIFLIISFLGVSLMLTLLADVFYRLVVKQISGRPKIGDIMLSEGFISQEDLKAALLEQSRRLGEILLQAGRITAEQRDQALNTQKTTGGLIGQILTQLGFAAPDDIDWAIKQMERKIGQILKDKKALSDYDLTCALALKKYRIDANGKIFIIE